MLQAEPQDFLLLAQDTGQQGARPGPSTRLLAEIGSTAKSQHLGPGQRGWPDTWKGSAFPEGSSGALNKFHPRFLALDSKEVGRQEADFLGLRCGPCVTRKSGCTSDPLHVSPLSLTLGSLRAMSRPRALTGHLKPLGSNERCSQGLGRLIPCSYCLALSTRRRLIPKVEPCLLSRGGLGKTCPPRGQEAGGLRGTLGDSSPGAEESGGLAPCTGSVPSVGRQERLQRLNARARCRGSRHTKTAGRGL